MLIGALDFCVVLIVLYLLECVRLIHPGQLVLDTRVKEGYTVKRPLFYPSERWGWVILNPLKPCGPVFSLSAAPYVFTSRGILISPTTRSVEFCPYDDCRDSVVEDDARVTLSGTIVVPTSSRKSAYQFTQLLARLIGTREVDRIEQIKRYEKERLDVEGINSTCVELRQVSSTLRRIAFAQFILCFGLFPGSFFVLTLTVALLLFAPVVLSLSIASAVIYKKASERLSLHQLRVDRYGNVFKLIVYPISTLRSVDLLSFDVLSTYDPIAVAVAMGLHHEATRLAAQELAVLKYAAYPTMTEQDLNAAIQEWRERRIAVLETFGAQNGLSLLSAMRTPERTEKESRTYCPQCLAQYRLEAGFCTDCIHMALQPLGKATGSDRTKTTRSHGS